MHHIFHACAEHFFEKAAERLQANPGPRRPGGGRGAIMTPNNGNNKHEPSDNQLRTALIETSQPQKSENHNVVIPSTGETDRYSHIYGTSGSILSRSRRILASCWRTSTALATERPLTKFRRHQVGSFRSFRVKSNSEGKICTEYDGRISRGRIKQDASNDTSQAGVAWNRTASVTAATVPATVPPNNSGDMASREMVLLLLPRFLNN